MLLQHQYYFPYVFLSASYVFDYLEHGVSIFAKAEAIKASTSYVGYKSKELKTLSEGIVISRFDKKYTSMGPVITREYIVWRWWIAMEEGVLYRINSVITYAGRRTVWLAFDLLEGLLNMYFGDVNKQNIILIYYTFQFLKLTLWYAEYIYLQTQYFKYKFALKAKAKIVLIMLISHICEVVVVV